MHPSKLRQRLEREAAASQQKVQALRLPCATLCTLIAKPAVQVALKRSRVLPLLIQRTHTKDTASIPLCIIQGLGLQVSKVWGWTGASTVTECECRNLPGGSCGLRERLPKGPYT